MSTLKYLCGWMIIVLALAACEGEHTEEILPVSSLAAVVGDWDMEELVVFNVAAAISETFSATADTVSFTTKDAVLLDMPYRRDHHYVYVKAGEQLTLDTLSSDPMMIAATGTRSAENEYLLEYATALNESDEVYSIMEYGGSTPDSFLLYITTKYASLDELVTSMQADEQVDDMFKTALANRLLAAKGAELLDYKHVYNYLKKEKPEIPADFYGMIEEVDLSDNSFLWFDEGRSLASSWQGRAVDYDDYDSSADYFAALLEQSNTAYSGTLMGDYCRYKTLEEYVNFGNGIDNAGAAITDFQKSVSNTYLLGKLEKTITPWLALKSGSEAPDFEVQDREGNPVRLADLRGKKVYIDVWATWCGPCIGEIPSLKELESDLHDENIEFVSVSIDKEADHQKWLDFIKEKELKGVQLMADGAWKSDVVEAYNIKGIPRFLLIDAEGKIISADAPRPSDPTIREVLMD